MIWHTRSFDGHTTRYVSGDYEVRHYVVGFGIDKAGAYSCEAFHGDTLLGIFEGREALEKAQQRCERHAAYVPETDWPILQDGGR
jgi:hypothetical protein